jgi:ABC-type protease/lipase transport system fused ATPase/permease subunit
MIAHRPSMMLLADNLLMLKDGMVAAHGPRDEVFAQLNAGGKVTNIQDVRNKKKPVPV